MGMNKMNKRRNDLLIKFRDDLRKIHFPLDELDINYITSLMQRHKIFYWINELLEKCYSENVILTIIKIAHDNDLILDVSFEEIEDYTEAEKDEDDE